MRRSVLFSSSGMSLVEVTLALGIAAFAIVVVLGLLPAGLTSVRDGTAQEIATGILFNIESDIRHTPSDKVTSSRLGIDLSGVEEVELQFTDRGTLTTNPSAAMYLAEIHKHESLTNPFYEAWHVIVAWPIVAPKPTGSVETVIVRSTTIH